MIDRTKIFSCIATLPDHDERLVRVAGVLFGDSSPDAEPWITGKELSKRMGVSWATLHRAKIQNVGKRITPGGCLRYRLKEVERYLETLSKEAG